MSVNQCLNHFIYKVINVLYSIYLYIVINVSNIHIFADVYLDLSQVKSSHLYLYSAFNNTNCDKATAQYQNGKIVSIM